MTEFYHFTCAHSEPDVRVQGLTLGGVLLSWGITHPALVRGYQWLTTDGSLNQPWATSHRLTCDRLEWRFGVSLPPWAEHRLWTWPETVWHLAVEPDVREELESVGGSECWRVYPGRIKPEWLREPVRQRHSIVSLGLEVK